MWSWIILIIFFNANKRACLSFRIAHCLSFMRVIIIFVLLCRSRTFNDRSADVISEHHHWGFCLWIVRINPERISTMLRRLRLWCLRKRISDSTTTASTRSEDMCKFLLSEAKWDYIEFILRKRYIWLLFRSSAILCWTKHTPSKDGGRSLPIYQLVIIYLV
jgi:hypothetical protein